MPLGVLDKSIPVLLRDDARRNMSFWRWLLFAAMTRVQLQEDIHLRIPHAGTFRVNVKIA